MSDNGTIVLDGLVLSGGGSGGGTAATTSFEPTATISSTNVQDAVEEVDAKAIGADAAAEAVAGDLADTKINGIAIAGKSNTCEDLGLQCELKEGNNITKTQVSESAIKLLLKFTTADGFQDISASPLTFSFSGSAVYGDPLFANSTNQSLRLRRYSDFHVSKPSGADWSKMNIGTGPFTIKFRRKCSSAAYSGGGRLASVNNTTSPYSALFISGSINLATGVYTPDIAITENAIEEILLTRLENGTFKYYKNGKELGTSEALNGVALDFSDWGYGFITGYAQFEDYVSGLTLENKAYTGGNYTPSEDYPTLDAITKDVVACKNYFGVLYTEDNTTPQTIPTGATYTKANAFNTAGNYRGTTIDASNNKIILPSAGYYKVGVTGSSKLGSAGTTLKTALFLNGTKVGSCQSVCKVNNANDESTVSFGGIVKVDTANSKIDVRVAHDQGGDVSLTTVFCNLNAVYIGDLTL